MSPLNGYITRVLRECLLRITTKAHGDHGNINHGENALSCFNAHVDHVNGYTPCCASDSIEEADALLKRKVTLEHQTLFPLSSWTLLLITSPIFLPTLKQEEVHARGPNILQ